MGSLSSDSESMVSAWNSIEFTQHESSVESEAVYFSDSAADSLEFAYSEVNSVSKPFNFDNSVAGFDREEQPEEEEREYYLPLKTKKNKKKKKNQVFLERYVEKGEEDDLNRTKSLTDEDLDELKGCLDLGFGFSYDEIPELCNTLPALELCYSMSQKYLDDKHKSPESSPLSSSSIPSCSPASSPIANWRISSPGDHPEDVKARLKYWAQAVACTVRLCS